MAEKKTKSGRWKIQLMAAAASNPFFFRFFQGTLYRGPLKRVCVPGLNCYSCPAAAGSCPLGALLGVIVLAAFFYRPFCKWICPLGAFYALFNKISLYRFTIDAQVLLCKQVAKIFHIICEKETALKRVLSNLLSAVSFTRI